MNERASLLYIEKRWKALNMDFVIMHHFGIALVFVLAQSDLVIFRTCSAVAIANNFWRICHIKYNVWTFQLRSLCSFCQVSNEFQNTNSSPTKVLSVFLRVLSPQVHSALRRYIVMQRRSGQPLLWAVVCHMGRGSGSGLRFFTFQHNCTWFRRLNRNNLNFVMPTAIYKVHKAGNCICYTVIPPAQTLFS